MCVCVLQLFGTYCTSVPVCIYLCVIFGSVNVHFHLIVIVFHTALHLFTKVVFKDRLTFHCFHHLSLKRFQFSGCHFSLNGLFFNGMINLVLSRAWICAHRTGQYGEQEILDQSSSLTLYLTHYARYELMLVIRHGNYCDVLTGRGHETASYPAYTRK